MCMQHASTSSSLTVHPLCSQELAAANKKLAGVRAHVAALDAKMAELNEQLMTATNEKNELVANAEKTQKRANLANRLLSGLGGEGVRWANEVATLDTKTRLLVGDVMLSSSFVAYIAPFSRAFRDDLVKEKWTPDVLARSSSPRGTFAWLTFA